MVVRKMLDMVFSQHDLAWIDDILPEKEKKKKEKNKDEDKKKGKDKKREKKREDEVRNAGVCCPLVAAQSMTWSFFFF